MFTRGVRLETSLGYGRRMADLSILIPARNEEFLGRTVDSILSNMRGDTEIIVTLDGEWAAPSIPQNDRVTIIYVPESVGQRAATNMAAKVSKAKYVAKCDAHCKFADGFDASLMQDIQDNWVILPTMYNLHAFDWVCDVCGNRWYQGPTPKHCFGDYKAKTRNEECNSTEFRREIAWRHKTNPETTSMRFDKDLRFKYWREYKTRQKGDLVETMSILGAFWMTSREMYFDWNLCDEAWGSWGQQGTEVACKTWLKGGKVIVSKKTWFSHMFRTQGGDFGHPYKLSGRQVQNTRELSKDIILNNKIEGQVHDFDWLLDKFAPIPDWHD